MRAWFRRWIAGTPTPALTIPTARVSEPPAVESSPALPARLLEGQAAADLDFVAWLLAAAIPTLMRPGPREEEALSRIDRLLADAGQPGGNALLPRSASVVPRLLALLRNPHSTLTQISEYISRDLTLVAEVLRMANGARHARGEPVVDLGHAVRVLGAEGLRLAIARAVVKPLIEGGGSASAAAAGRRLWTHTDRKAQLSAAGATAERRDGFEAYLIALVHNASWSAILRVLDTVPAPVPWRVSPGFTAALCLRRDRLFASIAEAWQLSAETRAAANDVARRGLHAGSPPPIIALALADRLATLSCTEADAEVAAPWLDVSEAVRECYASLTDTEAVMG